MSISKIQGQPLEVTVVGCNKLKDTEWISRQDPYVCLEYASSKHRTRTCTDGGKNPTFQEKFVFTMIEGLREINVVVWNSNTLTVDDFIGSGKVQLQKVISNGYDDSSWSLQDKRGSLEGEYEVPAPNVPYDSVWHAGEVRLIMHYTNTNKPTSSHAPSAPPYTATPPHASLYPALPSVPSYPPQTTNYSAPAAAPYSSYPPNSAGYPPPPYHHQPATYPPTYPPSPYPPPPSTYPPPPAHNPHYYPPGAYPPPPYPPPY